jgi:hypothetical protein
MKMSEVVLIFESETYQNDEFKTDGMVFEKTVVTQPPSPNDPARYIYGSCYNRWSEYFFCLKLNALENDELSILRRCKRLGKMFIVPDIHDVPPALMKYLSVKKTKVVDNHVHLY